MTDHLRSGREAAERLFDEQWSDDREDIEEVRAGVTIEGVAEALGKQIHADGLTCPYPDHHQTGHSAPASTFEGRHGIERWHCHRCVRGGDVFDYVIAAGDPRDVQPCAARSRSGGGRCVRCRPRRRFVSKP